MTSKQAKEQVTPFIKDCQKDSDPFFIAHFSKVDDFYKVYHEGLDKHDAIILMRGLAQHFEMDEVDALIMGFKNLQCT